MKIQQLTFHPQAQEYAKYIPSKYNNQHSWTDCIDVFIQMVTQTDIMHIVSVEAIVEPPHLVGENAASDRMDSKLLGINHVDVHT